MRHYDIGEFVVALNQSGKLTVVRRDARRMTILADEDTPGIEATVIWIE